MPIPRGQIRTFPLFHRLSPGKNDFNMRVNLIRKFLKPQKAPRVYIFGPDKEKYALFYGVGKEVVARKPPVGYENRVALVGISVNKVTNSAEFILFRPGWTTQSRYLLLRMSYKAMVCSILNPFVDLPDGG